MKNFIALAFARIRYGPKQARDQEAGRVAREQALRLVANEFDVRPPLSVSHLDGLGAAIASLDALSVGIDLVRVRSVSQLEQRYFLTSSEIQQRPPLSLSQRWALKEAAWKALRCTRETPLKAVELVHAADGRLTGVRKFGVLHPARSLLLVPWPRYVAAVVVLERE